MQEIASGIYDTTPAINEDLPRHTSKILQNIKNEKKSLGKSGVPEMTHDMKYEDW
jgi:hypothetical protein